MKIDFAKIAEEDKQFQTFLKEAFYKSIIKSDMNLIQTMYGFYQMGLSEEQVAEFIKNMSRMHEGDSDV